MAITGNPIEAGWKAIENAMDDRDTEFTALDLKMAYYSGANHLLKGLSFMAHIGENEVVALVIKARQECSEFFLKQLGPSWGACGEDGE